MTVLTNIDGSLKRDSNDCLVKDIEETKETAKVGCEKYFENFGASQGWDKRSLTR